MKEIVAKLWSDIVIRRSLKFFLCIEGIFLIIFGFVWFNLPPQLPLFYSLPRGTEQLANPLSFTLLPFLAFLIMFFNVTLSIIVHEKYIILSKLLIINGAFVSFIIFFTFLKIIITII